MQILTSAEMSTVDQRTAEKFGVPLATLMENAGAAVAQFCLRRYPAAKKITVLCGKGNNGGDGMVAARLLALAGLDVEVLLLGRMDEVRNEAAGALAQLGTGAAVAVREITDDASLRQFGELLVDADLIVDAVVGTGFKPPLRGMSAMVRDLVAMASGEVVAVDLPSGWDADSTEQTAQGAYRADAVVTFTAPKRAHMFGHLTGATFGPVVVAEIGSPTEAIHSAGGLTWAGSAKAIAERPRDVNSNKGKFGHVLVVGGSSGTAGAPAMASLAAMRAGAGLVTAAVPKSVADLVAGIAPELMVAPLEEGAEGSVALQNLGVGEGVGGLQALLQQKRISVIALGPGLSTRGEASEFARRLVKATKLPMVVDADALNAFEDRAAELDGENRVLVLTPHPGEMARLVGMTIKEVESDRVGLARRFATEHKVTLVLKGWRTLIAHPDGRTAVNTSGNPAMAKGGSGDILTGIVAAMLAQFPDEAASAVEAAVYLHGLAADCCVTGNGGAARAMDEHTMLATDTIAHLSDAFRYRAKDEDGMTWICGVHA